MMSDTDDEIRIDALRIRAFETNAVADRLNYFAAVSSWFQGRHERRMDTRIGLTDAQREAVERAAHLIEEGHSSSKFLHDAFPSTPTPPEPPKPERKVQRWEVTCCHWMDVKSLVAEGWEPYAVCPNVDEHPSHYLKRPIPGDAA